MPKGDRPITKQHTVPKVYLKRFSDDKTRIRYYDFEKHEYSKCRVEIEDICLKKNIYEFLNEDGNIDSVNLLEKQLGKYEKMFNGYCNKLESMMDPQSLSYRAKTVSNEDAAYWTLYTVLQYLRSCHTISSLQKQLSSIYPDSSENQIKNTVLYQCLPIFVSPTGRNELAFDRILTWFLEMEFSVAFSPYFEFITSDNPVCGVEDANRGVCRFVFPVTRNIAIQFIDKTDRGYQNGRTISYPTNEFVDAVNLCMGVRAEKQIYFERIEEELVDRIEKERALS